MRVGAIKDGYYPVGSLNERTRKYFQTIPQHKRYKDGTWFVHETCIFELVKVAYQYGDSTKLSNLTTRMQKDYNAECETWPRYVRRKKSVGLETYYATLHLKTTAPRSIVDAAWKVLAKEHHPDRDGDPEKFREAKNAYDAIKKALDE